MNDIDKRIINVLDKLRPFLISDGGNIEFIKFEEGKVYVRMLGACAGCHLMESTLKDSIEAALVNEIKEVTEVINVNN
ncbi:MAG: NifU family protein [Tenericutes bacterium]|jgi:Fe-S cluster biogenesis protein NfuA|nr:NifU family protein [Mycoplasmatota bacterium]